MDLTGSHLRARLGGTACFSLSDTILVAASRWDSLPGRILSLVFLKLTRSTAFVDRLCVVLVGGAGAISHCTCHTRGRWTIQIIRGRGDLFSRCGRKRTLLCAGDAGARNECDGRCRQKPLGVHKNLQLFECTPTFERLARSVSKTQTIRTGALSRLHAALWRPHHIRSSAHGSYQNPACAPDATLEVSDPPVIPEGQFAFDCGL
jgi:hypothetical protein